ELTQPAAEPIPQTTAKQPPAPAETQPPAARQPELPAFTPTPGPASDTGDDATSPPKFRPGSGIPIPNAGKNRSFDSLRGGAAVAAAAGALAVAGAEEDKVESLPHVVARGENFWTISRKYYGSGRYYMALWKANSRIVSAPDKLYIGTTILVPP